MNIQQQNFTFLTTTFRTPFFVVLDFSSLLLLPQP